MPKLEFWVQPTSATVGAAIAPPIQVQFLDAAGNPASTVTDSITIRIASNPGGGTLSGTATVAAANGIATFPNLSIDKQGEYALTAAAAPTQRFAAAFSLGFNVACTCWSSKPPMPTSRYALSVGVVNGVLYAVGGYSLADYASYLATVEVYDPVTNSWTTKAPMPTPRSDLSVGVVNGVLYAVGGANGNGGVLTTVEAYDPVANTWTTKAPMPTPRYGLAVGVVNGVLYAVGGYKNGSGILTTVEAYDPVTNSWTTKAPMPTGRFWLAVGVMNGVLYAVGGHSVGREFNPGLLTTVEAYDPVANSWTTKAPMPTPRSGLGVGVVNGVLYAVGGAGSVVEAYDPVANSWTRRGPMLTSRSGFGVGVVNGVLYAVGGAGRAGYLATVEAYDPAQDR